MVFECKLSMFDRERKELKAYTKHRKLISEEFFWKEQCRRGKYTVCFAPFLTIQTWQTRSRRAGVVGSLFTDVS